MIPFKGKFSGIRQYIRGKPNPWGLKVWARCGLSGIIYDFDIYQGKSTNPERNYLGVGASVVLKLIEALPTNQNYHIFADNFFTTVLLLAALKHKGFKYTGTVRSNRIKEAKLQTENELEKSQGEALTLASRQQKYYRCQMA
ncbi:PiggyBac transposable element-derived protein 4 [Plakobranchus ocellatus]|uniref:PiggyBac transposable element-derived protein 4 n=1 Tax=Plakobranchus ocellatus TaxID=259542 RepID=A0AAV3Z644_9GAST|nr:PiggyBac transposable element-derived protein 4 [Plakobranchus ocellatus]